MSQHDFSLANQTGASFRSDLNDALAAIATNNSGLTTPTTTFAYQWWADTTNGKLFQRNAANSAWVEVAKLGVAFGFSVPVGTKMLFQQTAAPTGWVKDGTFNNRALRIVSGTAGFGGSTPFTTIFGPSKLTGGHVLTIAEMPAHTHFVGLVAQLGTLGASLHGAWNQGSTETTSVGGNAAHDHPISMDLEYVDCIIAIKS